MVNMVHAFGPSLLMSAYLTFCTAPLFLFLNVVHIVHHYLFINKGRVMIFPILLFNTINNWYSESRRINTYLFSSLAAAALPGGSRGGEM